MNDERFNAERPFTPGRYGQAGQYALKPGMTVRLLNRANEYPLPAELKPGDLVRVVEFDYGYYAVEKNGRTYRVFMINIAETVVLKPRRVNAVPRRHNDLSHFHNRETKANCAACPKALPLPD